MPSLKDPLLVAGLYSTEVEKVVASAFIASKMLVNPVVFVSVVEYRSKPVNIVGEVKQPLSLQAIGNLHLLDVIARAGGLTPEAGSQILVSRPGVAGSGGEVQTIPVQALMKRLDASLNVLLEGGEEIRVPAAGKFFVVGNVKNPGAYQISEGEGTTVLKALALCQGTMAFSKPDAFVYRLYPSSAVRQEITVPIRKIMKRQAPDFHLEANDIFYVPDNAGKRVTADVFERIAAMGSSTATGISIAAGR
jgi:polysaccharide export outer membrane protein